MKIGVLEYWSVGVIGSSRMCRIPILRYSINAVHKKDMPPSTFMVCPVMKSLEGEARNNIAPTTSWGN
jgi:hypothetical protein